MIWYLTFTGMFLMYQLDVAAYAMIALVAKFKEITCPEPGSPWHSRWHRPELVEPSDCDDRGLKLLRDAAAAAAALEKCRKSGAGTQAAASWHISTQERVSISSLQSSALAGSSIASTSAPSVGSVSDSSGSAASGSQPGTPPTTDLAPESALQRLFAQLPRQSQLETVYSERMPSSPGAATSPHVSAKGLRCRAGCSDDGGQSVSTPPGHIGFTVYTNSAYESSPTARPLDTAARWWTSATEAEIQEHSCPEPQLTEIPPPSSAVARPGQTCLLPASLVSLYDYFPIILVQLPMYNEEAHCEVVIERACNIIW